MTRIGLVTLTSFFLLVGALFISDGFESESGETIHNLMLNFAFTLLGVALTVLVIDRLNEKRSKAERKDTLIRDLGVGDKSVSLRALNELANVFALTDGSLSKKDFTKSEFFEIDLAGFVADNALFIGSKFIKCDLANSSLIEASLNDAFFEKCGMDQSNLEKASMIQSTFIACDLRNANITGADLRGAHFKDCRMSQEFKELALKLGATIEGSK